MTPSYVAFTGSERLIGDASMLLRIRPLLLPKWTRSCPPTTLVLDVDGFVAGNQIARRVMDNLVDFSGETSVPRNLLGQLTALIVELEAVPDPDEVFGTLMCLRDDVRDEQGRLDALNDCITQAEEQIKIKEEHVRVMEAEANDARVYYLAYVVLGIVCGCYGLVFGKEICLFTVSSSLEHFKLSQDGECCSFLKFVSSGCFRLWSSIFADKSDKEFFLFGLIKREIVKIILTSSHRFGLGIELRGVAIHICTFLKGDQIDSGATYILIEQGGLKEDLCMIAFQPQGVSVWEGAEAVLLQAKEIKLEYSRNIVINSRVMPSWREIVSLTILVKLTSYTVSLSNKRRLVAELEVLGELEGAVKALEHIRVIVGRDTVTLGELEALWARA
nr:hypothetical protein [Tanacetum cinerariifolium]